VAAAGAVVSAAAAFTAAAVLHASGGGGFDVAWAPTWDLRLAFELDGLAALYVLLATGVGALVFLYASAYVPRHLDHLGRRAAEDRRFHASMVLFMVSMVGLATTSDLIALFVFWDLTAIASYLLIGYDRERPEARFSALMAFLVTAVSAVLMLIGILLLYVEYGTFSIPEIFAAAEPGTTVTLAGALIAVGALAKSAQVPLHFWLPRAMAAPTPVSAYLHSAAMVAAGVFVVSRVHPLLEVEPVLLDGLLVVGVASMAVGGVLALGSSGLKELLAYSTISQYGYVVTMLGIGGPLGAGAACFYVIAHAIAKSALFLTAGAVTEATGAKELEQTGGLLRRMPLLAAASGVAAAGIAALPLTIGFFKDELFFKAALEHSTLVAVLAVAGAALTFAYMGRFWIGLFLGAPRPDQAVEALPRRMTWTVAVLAVLTALGGIVVGPFVDLAEDAGAVTAAQAVTLDAAYHLDTRTENLMALAAWTAGGLVLAGRGLLARGLLAVRLAGDRLGPERVYVASMRALNRLSDRVHDIEVRDLRTRIASVLIPGATLVLIGLLFTPTRGTYEVGEVPAEDLPLVAALAVCALAAVGVCIPRRHLPLVLALSGVGFSLAVAFALLGAPDVALVAVLIETIFALLFLGIFALLPREVLRREANLVPSRSRRLRDVLIASATGLVTTLVVWGAFSRTIPEDTMAERHIELAPEAHGKDVVTVILADFRGLDTLVEITVVAVAVIGVAGLLRGRLR
jgi:multicomponent Na+:H+ antiporter subunit A